MNLKTVSRTVEVGRNGNAKLSTDKSPPLIPPSLKLSAFPEDSFFFEHNVGSFCPSKPVASRMDSNLWLVLIDTFQKEREGEEEGKIFFLSNTIYTFHS